MKNLKGIVFGFIAMVAMIGGVSAANYSEDSITTSATLSSCIGNGATDISCKLSTDISASSAISIAANKNVTIDLGGKTLIMGTNTITVSNGATLTIKNGKLTSSVSANNSGAIVLTGGANGGTLNVESVEITTTTAHAGIIINGQKVTVKVDSDSKITSGQDGIELKDNASLTDIKLDIAGTISAVRYGINVPKNVAGADITVNADITSTGNSALYAHGTATWLVKDGTYTGGNAFNIGKGTIVIDNGNFVGTTSDAIYITNNASNETRVVDLTINDGTFTGTEASALYENKTAGATAIKALAINGGTFIGSEDDGAINVNSPAVKQMKFITNGKFSSDVTNYVAEGIEINTDNDGYYVIGTVQTDDNQSDDQVVDGDNIGGTTDSNEANPNTADVNIMTLVGTILVGLAGFAYTMKNRLFN